jgi:hypothetical protein
MIRNGNIYIYSCVYICKYIYMHAHRYTHEWIYIYMYLIFIYIGYEVIEYGGVSEWYRMEANIKFWK